MRLEEHPTVKKYRKKATADSPSANRDKLDSEWLKRLALEAGADDAAPGRAVGRHG